MIVSVPLMPMLQVIDPVSKAINIVLTSSIQDNSVEIARSVNAMTFQQGQIEEIKTFLGVTDSPELTYIQSIWA